MRCQSVQEEAKGEVERERRQWRKAAAAREAARSAKHTATVRGFVNDLVTFALRCAEHRERTGLNVPRKEYNGWLAALVAGADRPHRTTLATSDAPLGGSVAIDDVLDAAALDDYLNWRGEWAVPPHAAAGTDATADALTDVDAAPLSHNEPLAQAVHAVRAQVDPPAVAEAEKLDMPVRIAVVGGPFTGKSTLAAALAERHNAALLEAEALVTAAAEAAAAYTASEPQVRVAVLSEVHDELHTPGLPLQL